MTHCDAKLRISCELFRNSIKIDKMDFEKLEEAHFNSVIRRKNKLLLRPTKSTGELKVLKEAIPTGNYR